MIAHTRQNANMVDPENLYFSGKKKKRMGAEIDTLLTIFAVMLRNIRYIDRVSN